jgi:PAS domain S-box-containing protein
MERDRQWTALHKSLNEETEQLAIALALPVWNIDSGQIDRVIESTMHEASVYGIVVEGAGKIHARARDSRWRVVPVDGDFFVSGLFSHSLPITFGKEAIGSVKLYMTSRFVEERLRTTLYTSVIAIVLLDLTLILSLYLLLSRTVLNPLREVERYAAAVSSGSAEWVDIVRTVFRGELEHLRTSIEKMVNLLAVRYAELEMSEKKFRAIFNGSNDAIFIHDADTVAIVDVNGKMSEMYGYSHDEAVATDVGTLSVGTTPYSQEDAWQWLTKARLEGPQIFEWHARHKDGHLFWVEVNMRIISIHNAPYVLVTVRDISERKRAEEALQLSEEKFRTIFENAPVGIFQSSLEGKLLSANATVAEMFGYGSADEILEDLVNIREQIFVHSEQRSEIISNALAMDNFDQREVEYRRRDGSTFVANLYVRVVRSVNGEVAYLEGFVEDISERKRAQEALQLSEEKFRTIFENAPIGIFQSSLEGTLLSVNTTAASMNGYSSADEFIQDIMNVREQMYVHPEQRGEIIASAMATDKFIPYEIENRRRDGSVFVANLHIRVVRDDNGEPAYLEGFLEDITERKRAEAALLREKLFVDAILESLPGVFFLLDEELRLVRWNRNYEIVSGFSAAELATQHAFDLVAEEDRERMAGVIDRLLNNGGIATAEACSVMKDGKKRPFFLTGLLWEIEGTKYILGTGIDITDRKRAEEEIQQLLDQVRQDAAELEQRVAERTAQLKAANEQLEAFAYSVSHDLKAPLRGIDGYSRLLLEDYASQLDNDGRFFITTIRNAALQMTQLIDDLLAYSRLERRAMAASVIQFPAFVEAVLSPYSPQMETLRVALKVSLPPAAIQADADALGMALRNLVDNAIKFTRNTPEPLIEIGGKVTDTSYILWVRDNGIGFDMQYRDRIFEIFQRLQRSEEYPGTGVGLALVRKAMERMGGRAWAESSPGEGATFYLEVPQ